MRRRSETDVPARLLTFTADDWPGDDDQERFAAWLEAREAWHAEHGWPRGEVGWQGAQVHAAAQTPDEPWFPPPGEQVRDA